MIDFISCVIIGGYASDIVLNECVESFRRQTYPRRELVIINDNANRSIGVSAPFVRVVDIPDFTPSMISSIISGDIICTWPLDRVPFPIKLSNMFSHMVDDCVWTGKCLDFDMVEKLVSPSIMIRKSSIDGDRDIDGCAEPKCEMHDICDAVSHASGVISERCYILPAWSDHDYSKVCMSCRRPTQPVIHVFLMMYNLLSWPMAIIKKLMSFDNINIVLIDQGSTYKPLLDFYGVCGLKVHNVQDTSRIKFIKGDIVREYCGDSDFFVVIENDINIDSLPSDIIDIMVETICDYGGLASGLKVESREIDFSRPPFWDRHTDALFPFTMYRVGRYINSIPQIPIDGHCVRHCPDEIDIADGLSEEMLYCVRQRLLHHKSANPGLIDIYLDLIDQTSDNV